MPLLAALATGVSFSSPLYCFGAGVFSAGDNMSERSLGVLVLQNEQEAGPLEILNKGRGWQRSQTSHVINGDEKNVTRKRLKDLDHF